MKPLTSREKVFMVLGMITGAVALGAFTIGYGCGNIGRLSDPIADSVHTGQETTEPMDNRQPTIKETEGRSEPRETKTKVVKPDRPSYFDRVVEAIIKVESSGKRRARGRAGERGLMQIKRSTWFWTQRVVMKKRNPYPWSWAYNAKYNVIVGTAYLRYCLKVSRGDMDWAIIKFNRGHHYRGNYRRYLYKVKAKIR